MAYNYRIGDVVEIFNGWTGPIKEIEQSVFWDKVSHRKPMAYRIEGIAGFWVHRELKLVKKGATQVNNIQQFNSIVPPRRILTADEIHALVDSMVDLFVTTDQTFTAYTVTKALRIENPTCEIVHDPDVRQRVHFLMDTMPGYDAEARDYNGESALTYFPIPAIPATNVTVTRPAPLALPGVIIVMDDGNDN